MSSNSFSTNNGNSKKKIYIKKKKGQQVKNRVGRVTGNRQFFLLSLMVHNMEQHVCKLVRVLHFFTNAIHGLPFDRHPPHVGHSTSDQLIFGHFCDDPLRFVLNLARL